MQQEHRHRLVDTELRCWQAGEIAARSAHLYYSQYQRTCDTALLSEAFVFYFYHAVLDRAYFVADADHLAPTKHLRFLARFLLVALFLARRAEPQTPSRASPPTSAHSTNPRRHSRKPNIRSGNMSSLHEHESTQVQAYSYAFDPPPGTLPAVPPTVKKRGLVLSDAILCSYYHNEVKFTDLTIDVFRMLQCLEWNHVVLLRRTMVTVPTVS